MKNMLSSDSPTELQDQAVALGRKLGFFVASLNTSDEVKQAWLTLFEHLSLQQLIELTDLLEARFLHEQTGAIDQDLHDQLAKILAQGKAEQEQAEKVTLQKLDALEQALDKVTH